MEQPTTFADRLAVLREVTPLFQGVLEDLHQASGPQVAEVVTLFDTLSAEASRGRTVTIAHAIRRGEVDGGLGGWLRQVAPSLRQGGLHQVARLASEATKGGPLVSDEDCGPDPDSPLGIVWDAVTATPQPRPVDDAESVDPVAPGNVEPGAVESVDPVEPGDVESGDVESGDDTNETVVTDVTELSPAEDQAAAPLLSVPNALAVLNEMKALEPRLRPEAVPTVTKVLVELCLEWGPAHMRTFRVMLIAKYGAEGELDDLQDKLATAAYLSQPQVESGGLTEYQMAMTPAQAAIFEAALGNLSAPQPNPQTGERDLRPAGQRRLEALLDICRRALGDQVDDSSGTAAGAYAALHVNLNLEDLRRATGTTAFGTTGFSGSASGAGHSHTHGGDSTWSTFTAHPERDTTTTDSTTNGDTTSDPFEDLLSGEVMGSTAYGTLLSPAMVRQLACGAHLIPHVLGSQGEHLDQGREIRLVNRAQRRALLRRDKHCTYPGCDRPGTWCRAHHVLHWFDDGATDLDNSALLCERHHTTVHKNRLWAHVRATPDEHGRYVTWDLTHGSYDTELERRTTERALHDPPRLTPARAAEILRAANSPDPDERAWAKHLSPWYHSPPDAWHDGPDPNDPHDPHWVLHDPLIWDEHTQTFIHPPTAA